MRLLQLSDPHLLADGEGTYRGRRPAAHLAEALRRGAALDPPPDLLLISGDLCQDESWSGYLHLRQLLQPWPTPVALLSGNHDHPQLLRAALGRRAVLAPAVLERADSRVLLLASHQAGRTGGALGRRQLGWLAGLLQGWARQPPRPLLVAVHHPPVPIGDPVMDAIGLDDGAALLELLRPVPSLVGVVFGHVHQHWQADLPGRAGVPLLGCPSTLCGFGPVQPCPLGSPDDPGGRWLEIDRRGRLHHRLLRWPAPTRASA
ncbi:metallophosphoesterase [Cyanobium sp. CH-040]|uniref:metallophosphoesterase n=1 Tax=Cyanobium sp. CH-040 TaxID=2823708 RepID=UPI0020CEE58F|nr:metallophosphoesterase [Cyanobium sp. CH-040]MCP9927958.1 metallophosphoesterase [Cyanobium sp. CH-040]